MARTKLSRGKEPFQMKSGNSTAYPFLGAIGKGIGKLAKASPIGHAVKALKGGGGQSGMGTADDVNTKIDEIHAALVGGDEMSGGIGDSAAGEARSMAAALTKNKKYS